MRRTQRQGAGFYLVGALFDPTGYAANPERLAAYATRHAMTVVLAHSGGPATDFEFSGRSTLSSNSGSVVARLEGTGVSWGVGRRSAGRRSGKAVPLSLA
jgi:hypothetical protein